MPALAGNDMTSIVVGVTTLSALISAWPIIGSGNSDDIGSISMEDNALETVLNQLEEDPQMGQSLYVPANAP